MAWKSNKWGAFPKDFGFSGSAGMREVKFMAHGGKVSKTGTVKGKPDTTGESPAAPPGKRNTDIPKFSVTTIADKSKDATLAGKSFVGSPSHGKGARTPGGTRMPKAKGGRVEGSPADVREDAVMAKRRGMTAKQWEASAADAKHDRPARGALAAPRSRSRGLPTLSMKPRFS